MIFNSITYVCFLFVVVALYWNLSRRYKLALLLFSSIVFYGFWDFRFLPLLFISVCVDYYFSIFISESKDEIRRKFLLILSLVINLSLLGFFKYFYFFAGNITFLSGLFGVELSLPLISIILPIGISFYTFQSMSYTIDVYRGHRTPTKDFLLFANYVTFFPQLVAGPILRANEVIWQLDKKPIFDSNLIHKGILRILGGLALKVLIADNIANHVDVAFTTDPKFLSIIDVSTMAFLFGLQIYLDFAAYSHIAIGTALLMGIKFPENFNFPYSASSPRDFWQRWHISLSSWIRDYLYLPLLGVRPKNVSTGGITTRLSISEIKTASALFLTWAIMGLWHGANWTFVVWGLWHASLIYTYRLINRIIPENLPRFIYFFGSYLSIYIIMLGWIPFRAESLNHTFALFGAFFDLDRWFFLGLRENTYLITLILFFAVKLTHYFWNKDLAVMRNSYAYSVMTWVILIPSVLLVLMYLRPLDQFIYFQF